MTAGVFFAIMAIVGILLLTAARKACGRGKGILIAFGATILAVSLFGVFTALI